VQSTDDRKRLLGSDPAWRSRAASEWDAQRLEFFPHRNIDRVRLTSAPPQWGQWVGRSLAEWASEHGGHPSDALVDWVLANDLRPGLNYTTGNSDLARVGELCADPATLIAASDAGAHLRMFCASGDTTLLLTRHVRERADLTLETAIHELTAKQAAVFGLRGKGRIKVGDDADLVVFDLDALNWSEPELVNDVPPSGTPRYRRPPGGYRATIVEGTVTQWDGTPTGELPGTWVIR